MIRGAIKKKEKITEYKPFILYQQTYNKPSIYILNIIIIQQVFAVFQFIAIFFCLIFDEQNIYDMLSYQWNSRYILMRLNVILSN